MPIYAYRCTKCGHAEDTLQKMSDAPLTTCPACEQSTYVKQVTAAGFQLKGSGWYVTDFRDKAKPSGTSPADTKADTKADAKANTTADPMTPAATAAASTTAESKPSTPTTKSANTD